jgi:hypothetical protein
MSFFALSTKHWAKWFKTIRLSLLSAILLTSLLYGGAFSQIWPGCEVSQQTVTKANALLKLTDEEKTQAKARHLLGGLTVPPADTTNEQIIQQHEWISWYGVPQIRL